jgi:hypothetical protein
MAVHFSFNQPDGAGATHISCINMWLMPEKSEGLDQRKSAFMVRRAERNGVKCLLLSRTKRGTASFDYASSAQDALSAKKGARLL